MKLTQLPDTAPASPPAPSVGTGPLVSFIMPVWCPRADWLSAAVRSALDQRGCRIELIVVDDGCEEPVAALLQDVGDPRLRSIRIEHGGVCRARNAGMAAACGTRFRFVDCDDVVAPDSTAHLLALMGSGEDVVAYGATLVCDAELRPRYAMSTRVQGQALLHCLLDRFNVTLPALLFPRRVVEAVGEWEPSIRVCEDWDFTLRALEHAQVRGDDRIAVFYRRHPGSASADEAAAAAGIERVTRRFLDRHAEARGRRLERRILAMRNILQARRETTERPWASARFWSAACTEPLTAWHALRRGLSRRAPPWRQKLGRALPAPIRRWVRRRSRRETNASLPATSARSRRDAAGGKMLSVPILMYHEVTPEPDPAYRKWSVALSQFRTHMRWLATAGYATVDLDALLQARCGGHTLPPRPVVITFDDGYRDCVRYTLPILRDHGFRATYFLVTALIGMTAEWLRESPGIELPLLSWRQVQDIEAAGCRCEAHSMTHPDLTRIPAEVCWDELRSSRLALEQRLGRPVHHMAYPYGKFDERVRTMARDAGYHSARSIRPGLSPPDDDPYALRQVPVLGTDSLVDFVCRLRTAQTGRELLYRKARGALRRWDRWRAS